MPIHWMNYPPLREGRKEGIYESLAEEGGSEGAWGVACGRGFVVLTKVTLTCFAPLGPHSYVHPSL